MKLKIKDGELLVTTRIYQSKSGAIWIDWPHTSIRLDKDYTHDVARDIPDFSQEDYDRFYNSN